MTTEHTSFGGFTLPKSEPKQHRHGTDSTIINRLPILYYLPRGFRAHFVAMCGEFAGTFLFLFFAFSGTQVANTQNYVPTTPVAANPAQLLYISLCFGFSLAVNAWVFFRISGGLFNPAVTLGLCLVGAMPYVRGVLITVSQVIGGIAGAGVVAVLFPGPLNVQTSLGGGASIVQGLFIEMFLTAQLVFTIFMLAAEKHKATFIAPIGIGLSLFIAELTGVFYTGGSLNPARSFGPSVILHTFSHYHWIYWLGPVLGALLASAFYKFIKMLEYETANPGQDFDQKEQAQMDGTVSNDTLHHEKHEQPGIEATDFTTAGEDTAQTKPAGKGKHGIVGALKGARKARQAEGRGSYDAGPSTESGSDLQSAHA